jgi:hypothetical protein
LRTPILAFIPSIVFNSGRQKEKAIRQCTGVAVMKATARELLGDPMFAFEFKTNKNAAWRVTS